MPEEKIKTLIEKIYPELVKVRRYLHQNPELSYQEHQTTKFIVDYLENLGLEVSRPLDTGCVAVLDGGGKSSDRCIALRADIDALPIQEEGAFKTPFLSRNPGIAHCCGHDVHTTNLLGAARVLSDLKDEITGRIVLIFQAGEEKLPGGGRLLCKTGFLQKLGVQEIYGLHTDPKIGPGEIALKNGPLMARPDEFRLTIIGKGGHAASPHITVDPIVLSAQVISAIQTIISRSVDPTDPAVVTIGKIEGGSAHNVISEKVVMLGTIRSFKEEVARLISGKIESIAEGITRAAGGDFEFVFDEGYPAVTNDENTTDRVRSAASRFAGNLIEMDKPVMAGEDFAFYQQHFPGTFFFLGSGSEKTESVYSWHHPKYNADEEALKTGVAIMSALAIGD